jgi:predicted kinase
MKAPNNNLKNFVEGLKNLPLDLQPSSFEGTSVQGQTFDVAPQDSRYDQRNINEQGLTNLTPDFDLEDARAREQGTADKIGNWLGRAGVGTGVGIIEAFTTLAGATGGIFKTIGEAAKGEDTDLLNNIATSVADINRPFDNLNEAAKEHFQQFYTKENREKGAFGQEFTNLGSSFWVDGTADIAGFVASGILAAYTGNALGAGISKLPFVSKIGNYLSKGAKLKRAEELKKVYAASQEALATGRVASLSEKGLQEGVKGSLVSKIEAAASELGFANKAKRVLSSPISLAHLSQRAFMSNYEAYVEAKDFMASTIEAKKQRFEEQIDPNTGQRLIATPEDIARFQKEAAPYGAAVYTGNLAALMFFDGPGIFRLTGGYKSARRFAKTSLKKGATDIASRATKAGVNNIENELVLNNPFVTGLKGAIKSGFEEGTQELLQYNIAKGTEGYRNWKEDNAYAWDEALKLAKLNLSGEAMDNFAGGFLMGSVLGVRLKTLDAQKENQRDLIAVQELNKYRISSALASHVDAIEKNIYAQEQIDEAIEEGDKKKYVDYRTEQSYNYLKNRFDRGYEKQVRDEIEAVKQMPLEQYNTVFNENYETIEEKNQNVERLSKQLNDIKNIDKHLNEILPSGVTDAQYDLLHKLAFKDIAALDRKNALVKEVNNDLTHNFNFITKALESDISPVYAPELNSDMSIEKYQNTFINTLQETGYSAQALDSIKLAFKDINRLENDHNNFLNTYNQLQAGLRGEDVLSNPVTFSSVAEEEGKMRRTYLQRKADELKTETLINYKRYPLSENPVMTVTDSQPSNQNTNTTQPVKPTTNPSVVTSNPNDTEDFGEASEFDDEFFAGSLFGSKKPESFDNASVLPTTQQELNLFLQQKSVNDLDDTNPLVKATPEDHPDTIDKIERFKAKIREAQKAGKILLPISNTDEILQNPAYAKALDELGVKFEPIYNALGLDTKEEIIEQLKKDITDISYENDYLQYKTVNYDKRKVIQDIFYHDRQFTKKDIVGKLKGKKLLDYVAKIQMLKQQILDQGFSVVDLSEIKNPKVKAQGYVFDFDVLLSDSFGNITILDDSDELNYNASIALGLMELGYHVIPNDFIENKPAEVKISSKYHFITNDKYSFRTKDHPNQQQIYEQSFIDGTLVGIKPSKTKIVEKEKEEKTVQVDKKVKNNKSIIIEPSTYVYANGTLTDEDLLNDIQNQFRNSKSTPTFLDTVTNQIQGSFDAAARMYDSVYAKKSFAIYKLNLHLMNLLKENKIKSTDFYVVNEGGNLNVIFKTDDPDYQQFNHGQIGYLVNPRSATGTQPNAYLQAYNDTTIYSSQFNKIINATYESDSVKLDKTKIYNTFIVPYVKEIDNIIEKTKNGEELSYPVLSSYQPINGLADNKFPSKSLSNFIKQLEHQKISWYIYNKKSPADIGITGVESNYSDDLNGNENELDIIQRKIKSAKNLGGVRAVVYGKDGVYDIEEFSYGGAEKGFEEEVLTGNIELPLAVSPLLGGNTKATLVFQKDIPTIILQSQGQKPIYIPPFFESGNKTGTISHYLAKSNNPQRYVDAIKTLQEAVPSEEKFNETQSNALRKVLELFNKPESGYSPKAEAYLKSKFKLFPDAIANQILEKGFGSFLSGKIFDLNLSKEITSLDKDLLLMKGKSIILPYTTAKPVTLAALDKQKYSTTEIIEVKEQIKEKELEEEITYNPDDEDAEINSTQFKLSVDLKEVPDSKLVAAENEIKKYIKHIAGEKIQLQLDSQIKTSSGKTAYGKFAKNLITLTKTPSWSTVYHEAFHAVFDLLITSEERQQLLDYAKTELSQNKELKKEYEQLYKNETKKENLQETVYKEWLADAYSEYELNVYKGQNFVKRLFQRLKNLLKRFLGIQLEIQDIFFNIASGDYANRQVNNTGLSNPSYQLTRGYTFVQAAKALDDFTAYVAHKIENTSEENSKSIYKNFEFSFETSLDSVKELLNKAAYDYARDFTKLKVHKESGILTDAQYKEFLNFSELYKDVLDLKDVDSKRVVEKNLQRSLKEYLTNEGLPLSYMFIKATKQILLLPSVIKNKLNQYNSGVNNDLEKTLARYQNNLKSFTEDLAWTEEQQENITGDDAIVNENEALEISVEDNDPEGLASEIKSEKQLASWQQKSGQEKPEMANVTARVKFILKYFGNVDEDGMVVAADEKAIFNRLLRLRKPGESFLQFVKAVEVEGVFDKNLKKLADFLSQYKNGVFKTNILDTALTMRPFSSTILSNRGYAENKYEVAPYTSTVQSNIAHFRKQGTQFVNRTVNAIQNDIESSFNASNGVVSQKSKNQLSTNSSETLFLFKELVKVIEAKEGELDFNSYAFKKAMYKALGFEKANIDRLLCSYPEWRKENPLQYETLKKKLSLFYNESLSDNKVQQSLFEFFKTRGFENASNAEKNTIEQIIKPLYSFYKEGQEKLLLNNAELLKKYTSTNPFEPVLIPSVLRTIKSKPGQVLPASVVEAKNKNERLENGFNSLSVLFKQNLHWTNDYQSSVTRMATNEKAYAFGSPSQIDNLPNAIINLILSTKESLTKAQSVLKTEIISGLSEDVKETNLEYNPLVKLVEDLFSTEETPSQETIDKTISIVNDNGVREYEGNTYESAELDIALPLQKRLETSLAYAKENLFKIVAFSDKSRTSFIKTTLFNKQLFIITPENIQLTSDGIKQLRSTFNMELSRMNKNIEKYYRLINNDNLTEEESLEAQNNFILDHLNPANITNGNLNRTTYFSPIVPKLLEKDTDGNFKYVNYNGTRFELKPQEEQNLLQSQIDFFKFGVDELVSLINETGIETSLSPKSKLKDLETFLQRSNHFENTKLNERGARIFDKSNPNAFYTTFLDTVAKQALMSYYSLSLLENDVTTFKNSSDLTKRAAKYTASGTPLKATDGYGNQIQTRVVALPTIKKTTPYGEVEIEDGQNYCNIYRYADIMVQYSLFTPKQAEQYIAYHENREGYDKLPSPIKEEVLKMVYSDPTYYGKASLHVISPRTLSSLEAVDESMQIVSYDALLDETSAIRNLYALKIKREDGTFIKITNDKISNEIIQIEINKAIKNNKVLNVQIDTDVDKSTLPSEAWPNSALKRTKVTAGANFLIYDGLYYEQQQLRGKKTKLIDPGQAATLILSSLNTEELISAHNYVLGISEIVSVKEHNNTYEKLQVALRAPFTKLLTKIININKPVYDKNKNLLYYYNPFREYIKKQLKESGVSELEISRYDSLSPDEVLTLSIDNPVISGKVTHLFFSYLKQGIQSKIAGNKLTLLSDRHFNVVEKGKIRDLKIHNLGENSYAEILVSKDILKDMGYSIKEFNALTAEEKLEIFNGFGYRIPVQKLSFTIPFKIVGFLPSSHISTVVVPKEFITLSGGDFDGDSLYINYYKKSIGKPLEFYASSNEQEEDQYIQFVKELVMHPLVFPLLLEAGENEYDLNVLDVYPFFQRIRNAGLQDAIPSFDEYLEKGYAPKNVLQNELLKTRLSYSKVKQIRKEMLKGESNDELINFSKEVSRYTNTKTKDSFENFETYLFILSDLIKARDRAASSKNNVDIAAATVTNFIRLNKLGVTINEKWQKFRFGKKDSSRLTRMSIDFKKLKSVDLPIGFLNTSVDNLKYVQTNISDEIGFVMSAVVDNLSKEVASYLNITGNNLGRVLTMIMTGTGLQRSILLINAPNIKKIEKELTTENGFELAIKKELNTELKTLEQFRNTLKANDSENKTKTFQEFQSLTLSLSDEALIAYFKSEETFKQFLDTYPPQYKNAVGAYIRMSVLSFNHAMHKVNLNLILGSSVLKFIEGKVRSFGTVSKYQDYFAPNSNALMNDVTNLREIISHGNSLPDIILPIGISGSGKSTWIKSLPKNSFFVISPDEMRIRYTGNIDDKSKDEEIYTDVIKNAIKKVKKGQKIIIDSTNLRKDRRRFFIQAVKKAIPNASIAYKLLPLNPALAKQRIKIDIEAGVNRANVPDTVIDRHAELYVEMLSDIKTENIFNYDSKSPNLEFTKETIENMLDLLDNFKSVLVTVPYQNIFNKVLKFVSGDVSRLNDKKINKLNKDLIRYLMLNSLKDLRKEDRTDNLELPSDFYQWQNQGELINLAEGLISNSDFYNSLTNRFVDFVDSLSLREKQVYANFYKIEHSKIPNEPAEVQAVFDKIFQAVSAVKDFYHFEYEVPLRTQNGVIEINVDNQKIVHRIASNFKDGDSGRKMRPEFEGKSTIDLIKSGNRKATTRDLNKDYNKINIKSGDIIEFYDDSGNTVLVVATTSFYPLSNVTAEKWSLLEGWKKERYFELNTNYQQFQFRLATENDFLKDKIKTHTIQGTIDWKTALFLHESIVNGLSYSTNGFLDRFLLQDAAYFEKAYARLQKDFVNTSVSSEFVDRIAKDFAELQVAENPNDIVYGKITKFISQTGNVFSATIKTLNNTLKLKEGFVLNETQDVARLTIPETDENTYEYLQEVLEEAVPKNIMRFGNKSNTELKRIAYSLKRDSNGNINVVVGVHSFEPYQKGISLLMFGNIKNIKNTPTVLTRKQVQAESNLLNEKAFPGISEFIKTGKLVSELISGNETESFEESFENTNFDDSFSDPINNTPVNNTQETDVGNTEEQNWNSGKIDFNDNLLDKLDSFFKRNTDASDGENLKNICD